MINQLQKLRRNQQEELIEYENRLSEINYFGNKHFDFKYSEINIPHSQENSMIKKLL